MYPKPLAAIAQNSYEFEALPLVKPTGFREYDARWLFGEELNLMGVQALGAGIGTVLHKLGVEPTIVVGHDFRGYSASIKMALVTGLMAAGCKVKDIGLALSPMAYYAQFALDCPAVAMVTASHNENGWTGVKMGANRPLTFGPDEMGMLRDIVLGGEQELRGGGSLEVIEGFAQTYMDDLANRPKLKNKLKVVAACGNGTAGAFAPHVLRAVGCEVIEMDCDLDHSFPNYNPNPEDLKMLHALRDRVLEVGADVGLAFDGDGDRCGVVDEKGQEIFADKVGVMLARDISAIHDNKQFVVDVKSTGLFKTDPVLKSQGAQTDYFKTGHSYIKRRVTDLNAIVGFEKSGHFFFNAPIGRGYDDGIVAALAVCDMLDRNPGKAMSDLYAALPKTYGSPTMSAKCADEIKYDVVDRVVKKLSGMAEAGDVLGGQKLIDAVTVNGVRVTAEDGTWGLVRASSNKPEIVVVIESPVSQARLEEMFAAVDAVLREHPEVGAYNQTLKG
ncbi:MAG: phosphomannomutase/phosphoglucomutase [Cohaesibacter sp.]|jgi:phosphomannomutase/phosphoglucomutase|nr:phosphomannomutase/phosphoglucomutase [Cohaesibacter sp.]